MGQKTKIEWTRGPDGSLGSTWNPVRGCSRVSPGCVNCYAERQAARFAGSGETDQSGEVILSPGPFHGFVTKVNGHASWTGKVELVEKHLDDPLHWKTPRMIFVNSMSDLFHENLPDDAIDKVFAVMALCPQHTFQCLTKRPERMLKWATDTDTPFRIARAMDSISASLKLGEEEVLQIAGYPGYFASSHGHIYSEKRGKRRLMKPDAGEQGHLRVQLHREGKTSSRGDRLLVHHLILETFVGPSPSEDSQGCHGDGNPGNNAISNLTWGTQEKNWEDRKRHGHHRSYSKLAQDQVEDIKGRYLAGESRESIARHFGVSATQVRNITSGKQWANESPIVWPLPQCWLGVSAEDQQRADERIPLLLQTPAAVRFVSYEPALGPVNFRPYLGGCIPPDLPVQTQAGMWGKPGLNLIIVGGESGPGARKFDIQWASDTIDQCKGTNTLVFVKQLGAVPVRYPKYENGSHKGDCVFLDLKDKKGGDMSEWPEDLRIRELPTTL